MDGGAWKAAVHGVTEGRTWLVNFTFTFHFHALEKEMATHSSVLAWRIPGTGEPGGLPSMGLHRVRHDWSDLAAAAAGLPKLCWIIVVREDTLVLFLIVEGMLSVFHHWEYDPAIPILGIYPEKTKLEKDTCIPLFIAALFTRARSWKQPRCPSADEWIKKLWYIYTMEYYSAIKGTHLSQF